MQPYVVLKRPGEPALYLLIIMLLFFVKDSYGDGKCHEPCYGPVWKTKLYSPLSQGYVHVGNDNAVVANDEGDGILYKISKGQNFYLYDANANKFLCWTNRKRNRTMLVARKFKSQSLRMCEFYETVSLDHSTSHVYFHAAFNMNVTMKFNKQGKYMAKNCTKHKHRHQHRKCLLAEILPTYVSDCECRDDVERFCKTNLRKLAVLHDICNKFWPKWNETYGP